MGRKAQEKIRLFYYSSFSELVPESLPYHTLSKRKFKILINYSTEIINVYTFL